MRVTLPWEIVRDGIITLPPGCTEIARDDEGITLEFADDFTLPRPATTKKSL